MEIPESMRHEFLNPRNVGDVAEPNFVGRAASFDCGAVIRISIQVDDAQRITNAGFKAAGCSTLIAAASLLTERVKGMTTGDAAACGELSEVFAQLRQRECVALAFEALISAVQEYSDSIREHWEGDEALICTCFGVSERRIESEIASKGLTTIVDVTRACNAGAGCRSCYPLIEELLNSVNGE
ncbi:MAG TPA: iron-sulfur cluster assembly scaffold protein [Pyrinomonadaceae bacterium]